MTRAAIVGFVLAVTALGACKGRFALPPDARFVQQIAVSKDFACGRMKDGSLRCWGADDAGQLGVAPVGEGAATVRVVLPGRVASVAVGERHACAILATGDVYCWGANESGQAGGAPAPRTEPRRVDGVHARALALGSRHSCAIVDAGALRCWGADDAGQREAPGSSGATAIAASGDATCAIDGERRVVCWGTAPWRRTSDAPRVEGLADVTGLALGPTSACAVRAWGGVACWGRGEEGQPGDGAFADRPSPADVLGLAAPTKSVAVARAHACASLSDETVRCWGDNASAQLADGTRTRRARAVQVQGVFEAVQIAAGGDATCAVLGDGSARCWGGLALPKTATFPVVVPTEVRW